MIKEVRNTSRVNSVVLEECVDEVESAVGVADLFSEFNLAGHGEVTSPTCGKFAYPMGCNRVELHNRHCLDGTDFSGKVYVKKVFMSCDKPSCPRCYKFGWAVKEADRIEARLAEASKQKHFGQVEHVVASVPVADYRLRFEFLRRKVVDILRVRGVVGGVLIFHRDRFKRDRGWHVSPHFHILGYVLGGYPCRGCKKVCEAHRCNKFEGRTRREFLKDGYIVKVLGKRKTVGGTAWYQLNHSSYRVGAKRSNVATWFGNCSYRKLKVTVETRKSVCPICQHDLERLRYLGSNPAILACNGSSRFGSGKLDFLADAVEDGQLVWVVDERVGWKGHG